MARIDWKETKRSTGQKKRTAKKEGKNEKGEEPRKEVKARTKKTKKRKNKKKTRSEKRKIKKQDQKKEDKKTQPSWPLKIQENTNKIITTGEGQNDHNKINIAKANTTRKPW